MKHRLEILELSCARGDRPLFEGLSQQVDAGELLHVAGSNGSGKTTLLRTLCGLSRPAFGEIRWKGEAIRSLGDQYRGDIAYVGHLDGVQGELTPVENLKTVSCVGGVGSTVAGRESANVDDALEHMGLFAYRSFPAKVLSQGQKRRLALARLLIARKPLWILDEPFTALDVRSCKLVSELLAHHLARGGVAVISSHQDFDIPRATPKRVDLDALRMSAVPRIAPTPAAQESVAGRSTA